MTENLKVDLGQTPEKYQYLANEVLTFLVPKLLALNKIEQEIFEQFQVLKSERVSENQVHPDEDTLWEDYAQRCKELIAPISLKPYTDTRSFGKPAKYEYLNHPDTSISLIIKSANRGVVETLYQHGIAKKHQFVLKKDADGWKIDTLKYGFPDEETWRKNEI